MLQVHSQHENLIIQSKELEADSAVQEKIIEKKRKYSELLGSDSMQEDDDLESQLQGGSKKLKLEAQFQSVQVNQCNQNSYHIDRNF